MLKRGLPCLLAASLALTSCAAQNGQSSSTVQTIAEGTAIGALAGAAGGAIFGKGKGALIGAAAGGLLGAAAGGYVAQQKRKYATIEQRIAGERHVAAQATATAQAQTAASAAQLQVVDAQLRDLEGMKADAARARDTASTMLVSLQRQRSELEAQRTQLETRVKNQQDFIAETEREIGNNDAEKSAQLAQWKAEIPPMQEALFAMATQISDINATETRVQEVRSAMCC